MKTTNTRREFSLKLKEETVVIEGKNYTIRELNGVGRDEYMTHVNSRIKFEKGKTAGMRDMKQMNTFLLSLCLRDPEGTLVPVQELDKWPASVTSELYDIAAEMSGLGKGDEEAEGEDSKNE